MSRSSCNARNLVIYVACCVVPFLDLAVSVAISSLYVSLLDEFGESRAATATVQSLFVGIGTCSSVFTGILIKQRGSARVFLLGSVLFSAGFILSFFAKTIIQLNIFICFLSGIGLSFIYVSSTVVIRDTFVGQIRDILLSIPSLWLGAGNVLYPYLLKNMTREYGVNGTFLILGGIYLNNFVISALIFAHERHLNKKTTGEDKGRVDKDCKVSQVSCVKVPCLRSFVYNQWKLVVDIMTFRYVLVIVSITLVVSSINGFLIVLEDIFTWKGLSEEEILNLFTVDFIASTVGSVFPIVYSKFKPGSDLLSLLIVLATSGFIGQLLVLFSNNLTLTIAGIVFIGLTQGGEAAAGVVAVANTTKANTFSVAYGILLTFMGILTLAAGPFYGYIRDNSASYEIPIILTAALNGSAAILISTSIVCKLWQTRYTRLTTTEDSSTQSGASSTIYQ